MPAPADPRRHLEDGHLVALADAGRRFWARVIDMAVLSPAVLVMVAAFLYWGSALVGESIASIGHRSYDPPAFWELPTSKAALAALVLLVLYEPVMVARWGATVGKLAMGLRVVRVADASTPRVLRSAARALVPSLAGVLTFGIGWFVVWVVLALSLVFDQDERGWHDKLAGTVVVTRAWMLSSGDAEAGVARLRRARRDRGDNSMDERWRQFMIREVPQVRRGRSR